MDSLEFAARALSVTGSQLASMTYCGLVQAAANRRTGATLALFGNPLGLTRPQTSRQIEVLVGAHVVERRKAAKTTGVRLLVRSLLPISLAQLVVDCAYGAERARPELSDAFLDAAVAVRGTGNDHSGSRAARSTIALAGIILARWCLQPMPSISSPVSDEPVPADASVVIGDEPLLRENEVLFLDECRTEYRLNYELCVSSGFVVPDVARTAKSVRAVRVSLARDYSAITSSSQLLFARPEKLREDVTYYDTIVALVAEWNAQMKTKVVLRYDVYVKLRTLLVENEIPPATVSKAFQRARTHVFWRDKPLLALVGAPSRIDELAQAPQGHDRLGMSSGMVLSGEEFTGEEF